MQATNTVPVFKLYGEERDWPTPDLLHCESILQRSSLYEWHIRMHQHAEMVQLLYLHKGRAEIEIEGTTTVMTESCIQVVPALCIHGFRFSPGTQGYVLSLALPLLSHFERQFGRQLDVLGQPQCVPVKHSRGHIRALFTALREEYCEELDAREMMLHSLLGALLVWLNRQCRRRRSPKGKRNESAASCAISLVLLKVITANICRWRNTPARLGCRRRTSIICVVNFMAAVP